jgi:hypothetical protein
MRLLLSIEPEPWVEPIRAIGKVRWATKATPMQREYPATFATLRLLSSHQPSAATSMRKHLSDTRPSADTQLDLDQLLAEQGAALARCENLVGELGEAIEAEQELQAKHQQKMRQLDRALPTW